MKMKKISSLLLLFNACLLTSQITYKITDYKGDYFFAKKVRQKVNNDLSILKLDGEIITLKEIQYVGFERIIPNRDYFIFGKNKITDYLVVEVDSINKDELFKLTANWIKKFYSPSEVKSTKIDGLSIKFEANKKDFIKGKIAKYVIEVEFKDGRYKINPISLKYYIPKSEYFITQNWGWIPISTTQKLESGGYYIPLPINDELQFKNFYNSQNKLRHKFRFFPSSIEITFNEIHHSLYDYILENRKGGKSKNEW